MARVSYDFGSRSTRVIEFSESVEGALKQFSKIDIVISCIGTRVGTIKDAKEAELNVNSNLLRIAENKKSNQ